MGTAVQAVFAKNKSLIYKAIPLLLQLAVGLFGYLAAPAPLFGNLYPMGVAVALGVRNHYAITAAAGAILGYFVHLTGMQALQYSIAIAVTLLLRPLLNRIANRNVMLVLLPLVAGLVTLLISFLSPVMGGSATDMFSTVCEVLLFSLFAFMIGLLRGETVEPDNISELSGEGRASLVFIYMALVISVIQLSFIGLTFGVILGALSLCVIGYSFGDRLCSLFSVACLTAICLTAPDMVHVAVGLSVAGLFAGLMCRGDPLATALLFFGCSVFGIIIAPGSTAATAFIFEMLTAATIFILIPKSILSVYFLRKGVYSSDLVTAHLSRRLCSYADALGEINEIVNDVFSRTKRHSTSALAIDYVEKQCCKGCSSHNLCWVIYSSETVSSMRHALTVISQQGSIGPMFMSEIFQNRCPKVPQLCSTLHKAHSLAVTDRAKNSKSDYMRSALSEQFSAIGDALSRLATEIHREDIMDSALSAKLTSTLKELGLSPLQCSVIQDKAGRIRASARCCRVYLDKTQRNILTQEVGNALSCNILPCTVQDVDTVTVLEFYECAAMTVEFAIGGRAADASGVNGDILKTFCDDYGNAHAILSDGMGKGKGAAIEASVAAVLTSKLLCAGFSGREVARLVNVALSLKADEEAGATLDIFSVNLYTGEGKMYKAGAAPTYLIRGDEVQRIDAVTLPVGILSGVIGSEIPLQLSMSDIIVMVSDGTLGDNPRWLSDVLNNTKLDTAKQLACEIIKAAHRRDAKSNRPDDMSVIVLKMIPAAFVHKRRSVPQHEQLEQELKSAV